MMINQFVFGRTFILASILLLSACNSIAMPLPRALERSTPLHFGLQVAPDAAHNPITPPERFEGYHIGTDFEVSAAELETDVPVYAICDGTVAYAGFAEGYGGLLTEHCIIDGSGVTVIYGHLHIDDLPKKDTVLEAGQQIGILGAARSGDTDGNRKHLHLGIHRGTGTTDMRGYVASEQELSEFIDAQKFLSPIYGTGGSMDMKPYWKTE